MIDNLERGAPQIDHALFREALSGSPDARLGLVDVAIELGESGAVRQIEALILAETFARLAAASGGDYERQVLAEVLAARQRFEAARGNDGSADWYRNQIDELLTPPSIGAVLIDGTTSDNLIPSTREQLQSLFEGLGRADVPSIDRLYDFAVRRILEGAGDLLEPLVMGELFARLGIAAGANEFQHRLCQVLLARARYETFAGDHAVANAATAEALSRLVVLADQGDPVSPGSILNLLPTASRPALAAACIMAPITLRYLAPEGHC